MFHPNENSLISEVPIRFPEMLIEQAFCVSVGNFKFSGQESLGQIAKDYKIPWQSFQARLAKILEASRSIKPKSEPESCFDVVFDISDGANSSEAPNPYKMENLMMSDKATRILIKGGDDMSRYSAALYLGELGFTKIFYS